MSITQDTTAIAIAATSHITSYITALTSPNKTPTARATEMATYYHSPITFFANGTITQLTEASSYVGLISGPLEQIGDKVLKVTGYRVEPVSEKSAVIWMDVQVKEASISNVYFFRVNGEGKGGFEGGIFDGEMWLLSQIGK